MSGIPVRYLAAACALAEEARKVRETKPNWGPEVRAYLANCVPPIKHPAPWCAAFVQAMTDRAAKAWDITNPLDAVEQEAYCPSYAALAKEKGWIIPGQQADIGDLVLYNFGRKRWDHIGIVTRPANKAGAFATVEGNTGDPKQDQRDGDGVYRKLRSMYGSYHTLFIRWDRDVPPYNPPALSQMPPPIRKAA